MSLLLMSTTQATPTNHALESEGGALTAAVRDYLGTAYLVCSQATEKDTHHTQDGDNTRQPGLFQ